MNMVKVLEKVGCSVKYNPNQTCCGQPAYNAGYAEEAKEVGRKFLHDFAERKYIVSPSGSCTGYAKKNFCELFDNSADHLLSNQVVSYMYEFTQFLTEVVNIDYFGAEFNAKVTYHDSCGALRDCGIKSGPRRLLSKVKGLELVEMNDCETCCGFGGTFAVKYEPISIGMAQSKVRNAIETGAQYIVSTDVSCMMHMQGYIDANGLPIKTIHIADILASGWEL